MKTARTILLIAFVGSVNVFTFGIVLLFTGGSDLVDFLMPIALVALAVAAVLSVVCIIFAALTHRKASGDPQLQKGLGAPIVISKILLIPYFLLGVVTTLLLLFASTLLTLSIKLAGMGILFGAGSMVFIPVMSVLNYLFILATSSFSISAIMIEYRKRTIKLPATVTFVILQLLPIADVISYAIIGHYFKKSRILAEKEAAQVSNGEGAHPVAVGPNVWSGGEPGGFAPPVTYPSLVVPNTTAPYGSGPAGGLTPDSSVTPPPPTPPAHTDR